MWVAGVWEAPPASSCIVLSVPKSLPLYTNGLKVTDRILAFDGVETDKYLEEICEDLEPGSGRHAITVLRGEEKLELEFAPEPNPEYAAGLRKGDRISALNGRSFTKGCEELTREYVYNGGPNVALTIVRDERSFDISYSPMPNPLSEGLGTPFFSIRNPLAVSGIIPDSPAAKAGLRKGDQLLQINDKNIHNPEQLIEEIESLKGAQFSLLISRNGEDIAIKGLERPGQVTLHNLGFYFAVSVTKCLKGMPAHEAGLRHGDLIIKVDGQEAMDSKQVSRYLKSTKGKPMEIAALRDGKEILFKGVCTRETEMNGEKAWLLGVELSDNEPKIIGHPNPWKQFTSILEQTRRTLGLLFSPITSKISGRESSKATVKVEHMSGPLGIVMMLWYSLKLEGLRGGFSLIILITFSLAIMNLLPIPVLDGGHIMFAFIETVIRRRLPVKLVVILQNTFAMLLIGLILYITFFDGKRLLRLFKFGSIKAVPPKVEKIAPEAGKGISVEMPGQDKSGEK